MEGGAAVGLLDRVRILYIDIDSCRPDHLGCYGYHRDTSPHIDRIAQQGVRFNRCYTSDAPCMPSRTALYSGRFGIQSGVVGHGGTAASPKLEGALRGFEDNFGQHGLARQLQRAGLHTAMISPFGQRHAAHWFYAGFNEVHNTGGNGQESAEQIWPEVESWLDRRGAADNWYLHLNFWDPHTPYRVPEAEGNPFEDAPLPPWLDDETTLAKHRQTVGPHSALDLNMYDDATDESRPRMPGRIDDLADLRRVVDGYDTAVRYVDDYVGRIMAKLKALGIEQDTAIVISADHGENLGELGIYCEHATADDATCRIPLIVRWPGGGSGVCEDLCYNVDWSATLAELLGQPRPKLWDGRSFAGNVLEGLSSDAPREDLIISQGAHVCQRAVRWDRWIYVRTYHDGFHLFPSEMLFDLAADPHEQIDLAPENPDKLREGAWRLMRWHDAQMARMAESDCRPVDPMWTILAEGGPFHARLRAPGRPGSKGGLEDYCRHLERTGRAEGARILRERYRLTED